MSSSLTLPDPASISARSRHSSISAIPRPKSGTSRHATPTNTRNDVRDSSAGLVVPLQTSHKHRKSWNPNDGAPPSSFRMVQPSPPSTESSLPYKQRSQNDLSGTRQQLYIRNLSTHSLNGPDALASPPQATQPSGIAGLPKSKTMSSLLASPREIIPRRRLLQPIGPPLPRTQTLGNLSCFGHLSQTPSPRKPTSFVLPRSQKHDNGSQLNVADALVESRMTEKEMDMMIQVQREAAANRSRLRHTFERRREPPRRGSSHSGSFQTLMTRKSNSVPTINLSANDVVNTRRLKGMKRRSSPGRILFINSTLANRACSEASMPTTTTLSSATSSNPSDVPEFSPKHVGDPRTRYPHHLHKDAADNDAGIYGREYGILDGPLRFPVR